jgi:hypothetical protein
MERQNETGITEKAEQDRQNRTSRRGQAEEDRQNRQVCLGRQKMTDRTEMLEQIFQDRDCHDMTVRTGRPGQDTWTNIQI